MLRSTSRISSSVRNTVPKLMGMMVCVFITVSITCSWARAFSRVGSKMKTAVRLTTAAMSPCGNRIHHFAGSADAHLAERDIGFRGNDAVNVAAFLPHIGHRDRSARKLVVGRRPQIGRTRRIWAPSQWVAASRPSSSPLRSLHRRR